jgi:hypothetical protein
VIIAQVVVKDGLTGPLERFGKEAPKMLDQVLKGAGYRYRAFLKKNYLRGQMLKQDTGALVRSIYVGKLKRQKHVYIVGNRAVIDRDENGDSHAGGVKLANIYEHAGGYTIVPKRRKRLFAVTASGYWMFATRIEGKERPFMSASTQAFGWSNAFDAELEKALDKALKTSGLPGKAL